MIRKEKMLMRKFFLILLISFGLLRPAAHAQKLHIDDAELTAIQQQIEITGSHHDQAFKALKWRIDQQDLSVYKEDVNRYNRSYLAQELAFASLIAEQETEKKKYARRALEVIKDIYNNPAQERLPHVDYGLSRAMMQLALALPYNWCREYWADKEIAYVEEKIDQALDSWLTYEHANFRYEKGSNWVAVCRGGELVLLLAAEQKERRKERYDFLVEQLMTHMQNGYGDHGATQEGMGYLEYGGTFLLKAVFASASIGDSTLWHEARKHAWWKLTMYAESFQDHARKFLMTGVAGSSGIDEGWSSLLLNLVSDKELSYYQWFYDRHMGRMAPGTEQEKYDAERAGTIWSILYYPIDSEGVDPTGVFDAGIRDSNGYFFFRNRWRDENDILFSIMADEHHHSHAWDQPEAFAINLMAHNTRYVGGPSKERENNLYSSLLVDGQYNFKGASRLTGKAQDWEISKQQAYVKIDGDTLYSAFGLDKATRHCALKFLNENEAIICIYDQLEDEEEHAYTWQLNLGDQHPEASIRVSKSENHFKLQSDQGIVDGWIFSNANPEYEFGESYDPTQIHFGGSKAQFTVLLHVHDGNDKVEDPHIDNRTKSINFLGHTISSGQSMGKVVIQQ